MSVLFSRTSAKFPENGHLKLCIQTHPGDNFFFSCIKCRAGFSMNNFLKKHVDLHTKIFDMHFVMHFVMHLLCIVLCILTALGVKFIFAKTESKNVSLLLVISVARINQLLINNKIKLYTFLGAYIA